MEKEVYTEYRAERLLKKYLPVARNQLVKKIEDIKFKRYPLVLKIISKQALHKSDINGVRIVNKKDDLKDYFAGLSGVDTGTFNECLGSEKDLDKIIARSLSC